jgi:type IV pilus assembly protein PilY1
MLHGFNASTGEETFAFIPTAVFPNLNLLTAKNYSHQYYVDGTPEVADVFDGNSWRTILVGTLRAGGKGLFALDVTDPNNIDLLWEFDEFNYLDNKGNGKKTDMVGPGYSFPKPTIARLHNGRWAVVTGNGYEGANTDSGKAALYIIDAITGELSHSLEVQSDHQASNGLSTPRLADYDGDGVADYAYAGDLHGNLWRFDLLGAGADPERTTGPVYGDKNTAGRFEVSFGKKAMFKATASANNNARQPIMAAPSLTRHPSGNGYLVIVGTGKYFEEEDKTGTETHAQSIYAIWDNQTRAESTGVSGMPIGRNALVQQTITATNLSAEGKTSGLERVARTLSDSAVAYYDNQGNISKRGWFLDLAVGSSYEGEMMIENMRVLGRDTLLISTLVPNDDPCAHGSGNWLYALNPATGGSTLHHAFDTRIKDQNGETIVSAIKLGAEGGLSLSQDELGIRAFDEPVNLGNSGRLRGNRAGSWRLIPDP